MVVNCGHTVMDQASAEVPSDGELFALRSQIDEALVNGATPARKALLQALVHEVRAEPGQDRPVVPCPRWRTQQGSRTGRFGWLAGQRHNSLTREFLRITGVTSQL